MKKYVISITTILLIGCIIIIINNVKKDYYVNFKKIQDCNYQQGYTFPINYFEKYWEFPETIENTIPVKKDNIDYHNVILRHFTDFLSKKNDLIYYIPLYNRFNKKREACLIISAGIDRKIDNINSVNDTIFIDEYRNELCFYNDTLNEKSYEYGYDDKPIFNIKEYLFGKKDYLVKYYNGIELHMLRAVKKYTIEEFIPFLEEGKYSGQSTFCFKGIPAEDKIVDNERFINFEFNGFSIVNNIYNEGNFNWQKGDSIALVGTIKNIDLEDKVFEFERCVQVDLDFMPY